MDNSSQNVVAIKKILSANDTGKTGGHQGGMLIPKTVLSFFPDLGNGVKNPRYKLRFRDEEGNVWTFNFIYYNNKFFSEKGKRNEYRLTGMTRFIKENNLQPNDSIILERNSSMELCIKYERSQVQESDNSECMSILKLGSSWKVVNL
ncbi:hypothetical protein D3P08_00500 [Paenibacillus nanensis]|uniref:TF-B3 domain-containing protein n=1 Tax=Paenibacillus nanensis TaxID=393251 RepID=A0A3A1VKE9_9BACL|nr:EcoRII N-terminal effector-binding domain-containing protein [Paenibacillus nanensis]RIX60106.1 hypothetical protein D3P08_00500 [Paenibacillus nanensis]